jgi:hypothetical protein
MAGSNESAHQAEDADDCQCTLPDMLIDHDPYYTCDMEVLRPR